jgi:small subunit ribosomal protein S13
MSITICINKIKIITKNLKWKFAFSKKMCDKCRVIKRHGKIMVIVPIQNINNVKDNILKELKNGQISWCWFTKKQTIAYALTYIHGMGWRLQRRIIEIAGNPETRSNDLTTEETITLRQALEDLDLKRGDLRRFNGLNIKRLNEINCHRGKRHRNNLPVRGQRTRTNSF